MITMLKRLRDPLPTGSPASIWYVAGVALFVIFGILVVPVSDEMQGRLALAAIGGLQVVLATVRPPSYWQMVRSRSITALFGDRIAVALTVLFGLGVVAAALWAPKSAIGDVLNHYRTHY